jgi:large subunit ribosomal protein L24
VPISRRRGNGKKSYQRGSAGVPVKGTRHLEKLHVKKDDIVEILNGVDKGKRGKILRAMKAEGMVVVEGVNTKWKHLRRTQENPQGGRVEREFPIHACKVRKVKS